MILSDAEAVALKRHLVRSLQPICDADPDVLADYVIALVKHDKGIPELIEICLSQLVDFLGNETKKFVDNLFADLKSKSFMSQNPSVNSQQASQVKSSDEGASSGPQLKARFENASDEEDEDGEIRGARRGERHNVNDTDENNPKRRRLEDDGMQNNRGYVPGKIPRRRSDFNRNYPAQMVPFPGFPMGPNMPAGGWAPPADWPMSMPMMGMPMRGQNRKGQRKRRPGRCHDYDEKGYCLRGDECPYEHGVDRIVVDQKGPKGAVEAYNPETTVINLTSNSSNRPQDMGAQRPFRQQNRGRGRFGHGMPAMTSRTPGSGSSTCLIVDKIPVEQCNIASISEFFSRFGTIVNITVDPHLSRALLQYSQHSEAQLAYECPDVIFNNRFVKVYWQKGEGGQSMPSSSARPHQQQPFSHPQQLQSPLPPQQQQIEAKKKIIEIQKQKDDLIQKQIEQQKELMEKIQNKELSPQEKAELLKAIKNISESTKNILSSSLASPTVSSAAMPTSETNGSTEIAKEIVDPDLVARLESLKQQAAEMGVDPNSTPNYSAKPRGGFHYSRARGRGRGFAPVRSMKLDNRTTRIHVTPGGEFEEEVVLSQFKLFGNVDKVQKMDDATYIIQYRNRREAEIAYSNGTKIPSMPDLSISWYEGAIQEQPSPGDTTEQAGAQN